MKSSVNKKYKSLKQSTPEYNAWRALRNRCLSTKNKDYRKYGGRGIFVCDSWVASYDNFIMDMGNRPSNNHSLDRIDVNDGYYKDNCRWATAKVQCNNKRTNAFVSTEYGTTTISELSDIIGVRQDTIRWRIVNGKNSNEITKKERLNKKS